VGGTAVAVVVAALVATMIKAMVMIPMVTMKIILARGMMTTNGSLYLKDDQPVLHLFPEVIDKWYH
jgi:hypothetical protein